MGKIAEQVKPLLYRTKLEDESWGRWCDDVAFAIEKYILDRKPKEWNGNKEWQDNLEKED